MMKIQKTLAVVFMVFFLQIYSSYAAEPIVVGMSAAFKGATGGLGIELYRGSMAYIQHINDTGGIYGHPIKILAYDDGYNPKPAIQNTIRFIDKDNVFLLYGYVGTPTVTRMLPVLKSREENNIFLFFPFTGAQPQREPPYNDYVFNMRASYNQETEGLVHNFIKIGRKKIAVFYQADAYGRNGWNGVRITLAKYGLKITAEAAYKRGLTFTDNLSSQVRILKDSGADAVISIGAYAACAAFIRDARDAGWNVPIANVSFVGSEFLINLLVRAGQANGKDYTVDLINSQVVPSYEDTSLPAVREYRELMNKYNQLPPADLIEQGYKPLRHSFVGFEGFLDAKLLVEILRAMGPDLDKKRIKPVVEGLYRLDIGIDSPVSYSAKRHQGLDRVYYTTYRGGTFIPLKDWSQWRK
ncbi:MAG TPA: ABC transporter substrate-binding protein [Dissulfurispiraceae bacterium]|nr:ABC transporter substrate-binding protein [Dissulfurispiraceae bacterium]